VVAFGPRLIEPSYQQLDFYYRALAPTGELGTRARLVAALALGEEAFHYTGNFEASIALRNMYIEVDDVLTKGLSVWAGSRMYRGDDIYLLDVWPLDNLNTIGAGAQMKIEKVEAAVHFGMNRLDNDYQLQIIEAPSDDSIGARTDTSLERQRSILSLRLVRPFGEHMRGRLYAERHDLPSGERENTDSGEIQALPADSGWVVGAQGTAWNGTGIWGSIWAKLGTGLGAYGDLTAPFGLSLERKSEGARLALVALSGAWEHERFALPVAAYFSSFADATGLDNNSRDYEEFVIDARPVVYLTDKIHLALDASYQLRAPHTFGEDGVTPKRASVAQFGVMPMLVPGGKGLWSRPSIRLIYAVRLLSDDAREMLWAETDERRDRSVEQYLGMGVEWWFNSTYTGK
jgi:maltoporin